APKVLGFKCYFISGMKTFTRVTHFDFERAMAEAQRLGRPLLLHAEDLDYVSSATEFVRARRGTAAPEWMDYADSRPEAAELVAAVSAIALARGRTSSLHVVHVGTAAAAQAIAAAGASCETCAHYLAFGREDFDAFGASLKTAPVVKGRSERDALWRLLADGTIGFVASDHAPSLRAEKETGDPWTAYGGIPGVGTSLPYLLSEGYLSGRLTLGRFLDAIAVQAAKRYGLAGRKGSLAPGKDADLVLVDPRSSTVVRGEELLSKGRITPFEGMILRGRIVATFVRGKRVYDAATAATAASGGLPGIVAEPGYGKFLTGGCS
ncbi:MAG: amidohydrolase family protein, partial [Spirochaetaceae bacterium]|nr:amidohydrolase family protein [Spirochaetaceae bacterium]